MEEGRRAGRTSSPDFFRTIGGLGMGSSPSLSSESCIEESEMALATSIVEDRECEILRASWDSALTRPFCRSNDLNDEASVASTETSGLIDVVGCCRVGDPDRFCSMILTAASSSCKFFSCRTRPLFAPSSSSLELEVDSGGEMTIPAGMMLLVCGGGD